MLDEMLELERTDQQHPKREARTFAGFSIENLDRSDYQRPSFSVDYKYFLKLEVGTSFLANEIELEHKEINARSQLRRALYGDVIDGLHEILGASSEVEIQKMAGDMMDELIGRRTGR